MINSIRELQSMVEQLRAKIDAPKSLLTILCAPADDGAPYIEVHENSWSYVSSERGYEIYRKSTCSLDELLYWIMARAVQQMAVRYKLENRAGNRNTRRIYFSRIVQLLCEVRLEWAELAKTDIDKILQSSPCVDF